MILFSAQKTAVHDMHLDALADYARASGFGGIERCDSFGALRHVFASTSPVVFSQSTGVASMLVLPLARLRGKKVVHYMHEPTSLRFKYANDPKIKATIWHLVQWIEMRFATTALVSRQFLLDQAVAVYGIPREKLRLAPLLMPAVDSKRYSTTKRRVTYLGRIDERRYFKLFMEKAPVLAAHGLKPTILTGDVNTLKQFEPPIPEEIELYAEPNFTEALKTEVLAETLVLWNPKRGDIAQSGVTADAVRHGLPILLTDKDPSYQMLLENGIALDFQSALEDDFAVLTEIDPVAVADAASAVFSQQHGVAAFRQFYIPALGLQSYTA